MSLLHVALMIAVAIETAVIVGLVLKIRKHNAPRQAVWSEPMPWTEEEWRK